jgi:hypothetical protein
MFIQSLAIALPMTYLHSVFKSIPFITHLCISTILLFIGWKKQAMNSYDREFLSHDNRLINDFSMTFNLKMPSLSENSFDLHVRSGVLIALFESTSLLIT